VAFSPFALVGLQHLERNWNQLSNIGQTYGAISALISSLALGGVIVSLLYQARDGRTAREQSIRTLQHQLIRMQMEDPAFMTATGAPWNLPIPAESASIREYLYIHMWVLFWAGNYVMGEMTMPSIKQTAKNELFNSKAGRTYWAAVGRNMMETSAGRYNRFFRILDEEYQKIVACDTPVADPIIATSSIDDVASSRKKDLQRSALIGAALMIGILAGRKLNQRNRHAS
jgi:Family of unknown function (DUF6082)